MIYIIYIYIHLFGGLEHIVFPYIGNVIIPIDIFQRGRSTTNQKYIYINVYIYIFIYVYIYNHDITNNQDLITTCRGCRGRGSRTIRSETPRMELFLRAAVKGDRLSICPTCLTKIDAIDVATYQVQAFTYIYICI